MRSLRSESCNPGRGRARDAGALQRRRDRRDRDAFAEPPVTFELRFVEELIRCRLVRKTRMRARIVRDIGRLEPVSDGLRYSSVPLSPFG